MNTPDYDAEQLDEFIRQLKRDLNTSAPASLDPAFAEFVRFWLRAEKPETLDRSTQARIWQQVRSSHQTSVYPQPVSSNGRNRKMALVIPERPTRSFPGGRATGLRGALTVLAAALILIVISLWLIAAQHPGPKIGPANNGISAAATQAATTAATAPATEAATHIILGPSLPSSTIAWSPAGDRLAVVGGPKDAEIMFWTADGKWFRSVRGHSGPITGLAWSPDGKTLASGGSDNSIRLWTSQGEAIAILSDHTGRIDSLMWSPDATMLASASSADGTIRLWTDQGQPILTIKSGPASITSGTRITWSSDSKRLLAHYGDNSADIWSLDGAIVASFGATQHDLSDIEWSPDSARVAATATDGDVQIFRADGALDSTLPGLLGDQSLRWSPDGKLIAVLGMNLVVRSYDVASRSLLATINDSGNSISDMSFSSDSHVLMTVAPGNRNAINLWDVNGKTLASYPLTQDASAGLTAAWAPGDRMIATWITGGQTPQILAVDDKVLAQAARTMVSAATTSPATQVSTAVAQAGGGTSATPSSSGNADQPFKIGEQLTGAITKAGQPATFLANTAGDGKLLIMAQSDDFSVTVGSQVMCANGGGGGGGGGGDTGGSPAIRAYVTDVCQGQIRLLVDSNTRTETGKFTVWTYLLTPGTLQLDKPITDEIRAEALFRYYQATATSGDLLSLKLEAPDGAQLQTLLTGDYASGPNAGSANMSSDAKERYILSSGNFGVLVVPAVKGATGHFSLTVTQEHPPVLGPKAQSVSLDPKHTAVAFAFKASDKPLVLKAKITSGAGQIRVDVMPILAPDTAQVESVTRGQTSSFTVTPNVLSSFKLTTTPDSNYAVIVSLSGDNPAAVELLLSTP